MSFPINPTNGQLAVVNNIVYSYNSAGTGYWTRTAASTSTLGITVASLIILNTSSSISTATGALVVQGGVGVGGSIYAGNIYTNGVIISTTGTTSTFFINNTTASTSTNTGALVVAGGVGIGGALYVNTASFISNAQIITTATIGNYANITVITAGTDTAINTSTGQVIIWNTSTLQTITNRGSSTTNAISISNTANSSNTTTGALTVSGGVGVGGSIYAGNIYTNGVIISTTGTTSTFFINNTTASTGTSSGALVVAGGVGIGGALFVNTTSYIAGAQILTSATVNNFVVSTTSTTGTFTILNTTPSTSTNTGALVVRGGVGIGGALYAGSIYSNGSLVGANTGTTSTFFINNTTASTGTSSGALVVAGGVGIGGPLFVNTTSYIAGAQILTSATVNTFVLKTVITAGTDTVVSDSTGNITIWNNSTLQTITNRGNSTNNSILTYNVTSSTFDAVSNQMLNVYGLEMGSAALQVQGGVGIGDNLNVTNGIISRQNGIGLGPDYVTTSSSLTLAVASSPTSKVDSSPVNWTITSSVSPPTYNAAAPAVGGGSIFFNGASSQWLKVLGSGVFGDPLDLSYGQPNWTVEFWFNASNTTGTKYLIDSQSGPGWSALFSLYLVNSALYWQVGNGTTNGGVTVSTAPIVATVWYHVVLMRHANKMYFYLNGVPNSSTTITNVGSVGLQLTSGYPLLIGAKYALSPGSFFTGYITRLRIVKRALYQPLITISPINANFPNVASPGKFALGINYFTGDLEFTPNVNVVSANTIVTPALSISNAGIVTVNSTATSAYALNVAGGVSIGQILDVGGNFSAPGFFTNPTTVFSISPHVFFNGLQVSSGNTILSDTTKSTSTTTGALTVAGGIGVGGDLFVGGNITANKLTIQLTTVTTTNVTTDDIISTYNNSDASSTATGALRVTGGAGIGKNLFVGGSLNIGGALSVGLAPNTGTNIVYFDSTTGQFTYGPNYGSAGVNQALIGNQFPNILYITNQTTSTDAGTGALRIEGGVGVKGSIYTAQKIGWTAFNNPTVSQVYQFYNPTTGSLDTVFG